MATCFQLGLPVSDVELLVDRAERAVMEIGQAATTRSPRYAQMLMAVASHPQVGNAKHASYLPASAATLYELTKVPEPTLKYALQDGVITPDMRRPRGVSQGL
ncbi:MAG: hypothetical protein IT177_00880 [Acidobacteria bacterium]|nr:hypothetical protein [Acidobacteriota bacterium]